MMNFIKNGCKGYTKSKITQMHCGNIYILLLYPLNLLKIAQDVFKQAFELYTWGNVYFIVTNGLIELCTNMKVNTSIQNMSKIPDSKFICEKYALSIDDPIRKKNKSNKILKINKKQRINQGHPSRERIQEANSGQSKGQYYCLENIKLNKISLDEG